VSIRCPCGAGAKYFRAALSGERRKRIPGLANGVRADVRAGHRIPAAHHTVGAAGDEGSTIRHEGQRPYGQTRTDQRADELALRAPDDRNGAADAGCCNEQAVGRDGERNDRRGLGRNGSLLIARWRRKPHGSVRSSRHDLAVRRYGNRIERCR
jgi:hypothetical protein